MENDNYIQQKDEIDLLNNIIPDKMKIINENPYELEISIEADVEKPLYSFKLLITLNSEYPNSIPTFTLTEENHSIASKKIEELQQKLNDICNEQIGMPIIYQLYENVLTFTQELEDDNEKEENKKMIELEEEKKLLEEKKKIKYKNKIEDLYNEYKRIKNNTRKLKIDYKMWHYTPFQEIDDMINIKEDMLLYSLKQKYFKNKLFFSKNNNIIQKIEKNSVIDKIRNDFNRVDEDDSKPRKRLLY